MLRFRGDTTRSRHLHGQNAANDFFARSIRLRRVDERSARSKSNHRGARDFAVISYAAANAPPAPQNGNSDRKSRKVRVCRACCVPPRSFPRKLNRRQRTKVVGLPPFVSFVPHDRGSSLVPLRRHCRMVVGFPFAPVRGHSRATELMSPARKTLRRSRRPTLQTAASSGSASHPATAVFKSRFA
jgi:hypothetical protein